MIKCFLMYTLMIRLIWLFAYQGTKNQTFLQSNE